MTHAPGKVTRATAADFCTCGHRLDQHGSSGPVGPRCRKCECPAFEKRERQRKTPCTPMIWIGESYLYMPICEACGYRHVPLDGSTSWDYHRGGARRKRGRFRRWLLSRGRQ